MDPWNATAKALFFVLLIVPQAVTAPRAQAQEWIYTVRPGDNPWSISDRYLTDMRYWPRLQQRNGITEPDHIPPGTRLSIPIEWLKNPIKPLTVRVLDVRGDVEASFAAGGRTVPLRAETTLQAGDSVRTGPASSALLKFHDASELLLQADSLLVLETLNVHESSGLVDAQLNLRRGRLETQVTTRRDPAVRYEITTPAAIAAVRGTAFRIAADTQARVARTEVTRGSVALGSAGRTTVLPEKYGAVAEPAAEKPEPVELLPAPDISALPGHTDKLEFTWPAIPGAKAYRVQLMAYQHKRFKLLVFNNGRLIRSQQVGGEQVLALIHEDMPEAPQFSGPRLPNDNYVLRVRGIDERGLEGLNGEHRFTLFTSADRATLR
jgi:hypothetical protein